MPKMKTKRALAKRVHLTGSGKMMRHHAYVSHLQRHKSTKQKKHLQKVAPVAKGDVKRVKQLIIK